MSQRGTQLFAADAVATVRGGLRPQARLRTAHRPLPARVVGRKHASGQRTDHSPPASTPQDSAPTTSARSGCTGEEPHESKGPCEEEASIFGRFP